jgi:non-heme chloroperoxidase
MAQTESNPDGIPLSVFDEIWVGTCNTMTTILQDFTLPFYRYNREGAKVSQGIRDNWGVAGNDGCNKSTCRLY